MATKGPQKSTGVPIDRALEKLKEWRDAAQAARVAAAKADKLKEEFRVFMSHTGQTEASLRGYKVLTYTASDGSFRGSDFRKERPDLTDHYLKTVTVQEIDWEALKRDMPHVWEEYRTRTLRPDWRSLETILALPDGNAL